MSCGTLVVAAIQMCSVASKTQNLAAIHRLIQSALSQNSAVQLVCLPECCVFMGETRNQTLAASEAISTVASKGTISELCDFAKKFQLAISVGGFPEQRDDLESTSENGLPLMSNTHVLINRKGEVETPVYRKIHLFDSPLANLQESALTIPGKELVAHPLAGFSVGLAICYDLRFPAFFEALCAAPSLGADLVLVPSAFTRLTGAAHWEVLLRARAIENQCYIVAAAQAGQHNENRASYGHSMIIDPWGNIVAQLGPEDEGVCVATIERSRLQSVRSNMPVQAHRRPDIYSNHFKL